MTHNELCFTAATRLVALIRSRRISPLELTRAVLDRIERVNPAFNAYCTVAADQALAAARAATRALTRGAAPGPLHGVPVSIKDLTRGIRTTWGSKIYEDHVPDENGLVVTRLKAAGAIVLGKTNTPEFGAGANTYNAVFGATHNPWNPALTSGGSTGGGALALATGMGPLAQGSDLGGSLRIPAAFCGVVGMRPSPGLVAVYPAPSSWDGFSVQGPMARTVGDLALMLSVIAGPDPRSPISYPVDGRTFTSAVRRPTLRGARIAWSVDLGVTPVDDDIARVAYGPVETCATSCAKKGQPVALVTTDGKMYLVIGQYTANKNQSLIAHMAHTVELTGHVMQHQHQRCRIEPRIVDRQHFEVAAPEVDVGERLKPLARSLQHRRRRVHGDDVIDERGERRAGLARAAPEITEHPVALRQRRQRSEVESLSIQLVAQAIPLSRGRGEEFLRLGAAVSQRRLQPALILRACRRWPDLIADERPQAAGRGVELLARHRVEVARPVRIREVRRAELRRRLAAVEVRRRAIGLDDARLRRALSWRLADWRGLLTRQVAEARPILTTLLADRMIFTARRDSRGSWYEFRGVAVLGRVLAGIVLPKGMVAPSTGFEPVPRPCGVGRHAG